MGYNLPTNQNVDMTSWGENPRANTFLSGANAKISISGGATFAFATDISVSTIVDLLPIDVMGKIGANSYEPVGYKVQGSLTILRYTEIAWRGVRGAMPNYANSLNNYGVGRHLDPDNVLRSKTFDLRIYQVDGKEDYPFLTIFDCRINSSSLGFNKKSLVNNQLGFTGLLVSDGSKYDRSMAGGVVANGISYVNTDNVTDLSMSI